MGYIALTNSFIMNPFNSIKVTSIIALLMFSLLGVSQDIDYNTKKGFVAEGYDVVQYFKGDPKPGQDKYVLTHDGVKFRFLSRENMETFKNDPGKYVPRYGGWCAWAIAENNSKVDIDPETYEIRDGKLYLFYNAFFNNTLESWKENDPEKLIPKADKNWQSLKDPGK